MSKVVSLGYTDTAVSGSAVRAFSRANLNYPVDFVAIEKGDKKFAGVNKTSPLDQLESIRVQSTEVADVYKGTSIDPSSYAASRKGTSILVQVNDILRVVDDADPMFHVDLPISAHMVVKVPLSSFVTSDIVMAVAGRALSLLFNSDQLTSSHIADLLRGSTTPLGL